MRQPDGDEAFREVRKDVLSQLIMELWAVPQQVSASESGVYRPQSMIQSSGCLQERGTIQNSNHILAHISRHPSVMFCSVWEVRRLDDHDAKRLLAIRLGGCQLGR